MLGTSSSSVLVREDSHLQRESNRANSGSASDPKKTPLEAHSDVEGLDSDTLPVTLEASKISGPGSLRNTPLDLGKSPLEEPNISTDSSMYCENVDVKPFSNSYFALFRLWQCYIIGHCGLPILCTIVSDVLTLSSLHLQNCRSLLKKWLILALTSTISTCF